jgi:hypothetical protein
MKTALAVAALFLSVTAQAARPNTQNMTAAQARALVEKHGSIALSTSSFGFDRFVAKQHFCGTERAVAAYVPTLDSDAAFIGYSCSSRGEDGINSSKKYPRNPTLCREGRMQVFEESVNGSDNRTSVQRVCTNGKWQRVGVDPVGPKRVACVDGTYRTQKVSRGGDTVDQTRVCRDGKWYGLD